MASILFVCTANRFRSPIAALYFAREVVKRGDDSIVQVSSAGTWTVSDQPATPDALDEAEQYELNLSLHKSRPITKKILSRADLILVMEASHKEAITHEFSFVADRIFLLSGMANDIPYDIPDPYVTEESPEVIAREIVSLIDQGYQRILELALSLAQKPDRNKHGSL